MKSPIETALACVIIAALAGCPAAEGEGEDEEDGASEACEHAQEGPSEAVTASATADVDAEDVSAPHTRQDVALVDVPGGLGGTVQYASAGGSYALYLTKDVPLALTEADGAAITSAATAETTCPEVVVSHRAELPVGVVLLTFGPTDETSVSLIVEGEDGQLPEE